MKPFNLPQDFLLGTATAATQIEGGNTDNNWHDWCRQERIKDKTTCARANDHWNRVEEDVALMKMLNQKVYRMGMEWSRIEPEDGKFDSAALSHYREEIQLLLQNGIKPLVTLHHFSHPSWLCGKGEFENEAVLGYFERYVKTVVESLGDLVCEYITINEPNVYVTNGYFFGSWPPGKKDFKLVLKVLRNMTLCHIAAYKLIHKIRNDKDFQGQTKVGLAMHLRVFHPYSKSPLDKLAAIAMDYLFQGAVTKSMSNGRLAFPIGVGAPCGKGRYYDFIGINYYTRSAVHFKGFKDDVFPDTPRNDLNWEIYSQGLYRLCKSFYKKYKAPIWITENGTCDREDRFRASYIYAHLYEVSKLCSEGIPVERYYHWTLMDNFDWVEGESAPFGLIHLDFETQKRTVRKSGWFYSEICEKNAVTEEMIEKYLK
ncbi:MAG: glycoside hydrolase family 1 protein [Clostridia bacterium]|nr:glycoside hydrolase family 1 protein [Clostridia bacterium]